MHGEDDTLFLFQESEVDRRLLMYINLFQAYLSLIQNYAQIVLVLSEHF